MPPPLLKPSPPQQHIMLGRNQLAQGNALSHEVLLGPIVRVALPAPP
jgi:hypothetical protein